MRIRPSIDRAILSVLVLGAAGLACVPPGQTDADAVATSVAATQSAAETATAGASAVTPPAGGTGQVIGLVCYPGEPPLPPMTLYFQEISSSTVTAVPHTDGTGVYSLGLPAGVYVAYAWRVGNEIGGSYSQAVPCGLTVACTDHSPIPFAVAAGETTGGVDICDWYGAPGDVPAPPGGAPPPATSAVPPPAGGVSFNCDGAYQRFRLEDGGASGKTAFVDSWNGTTWINVWSVAGGDPMIRQITDEAGLYSFGGCQQLVVVPLMYSGSGAVLELSVYAWAGGAMVEVYRHEGVHGGWSPVASSIRFEESIYLYGEPNCCPCNRQSLEHTWNGSAFVQTASVVNPTYSGTPPAECTP